MTRNCPSPSASLHPVESCAIFSARCRPPSVGVFNRLRIMHHWLYPQALRRANAVLDKFPYGGCLTALEVNERRLFLYQ